MQRERPPHLFARKALTGTGWKHDALLTLGKDGNIAAIKENSACPADTAAFDILLPGMSNVHSHSFQRAMAGFTEVASGKENDNFWSWRRVMYAFTRKLTPEMIETITRALYIELLKNGYTAVGEFHYLHHDEKGKPYASVTELSERILTAAQDTGIALTHLPVMYESGNFGGAPASAGQARFLHSAESYLALLDRLNPLCKKSGAVLGIAPHSLRAVTAKSLDAILSALPSLGLKDCPVHMHIAEQLKEVDDCMAWCGKRPVEWLLDHHEVNKHWCLIHSTHVIQQEMYAVATSGAVAGLCPTTESNLGDGVFPTEAYLKAGGTFAVGGDSHVSVSPFEELRQLECIQRLVSRKRAVLATPGTPSVGRTLYSSAAAGGAQAMGRNSGVIAEGFRADMVALSADDPLLAGKQDDQILDTLIFAGIRPLVTDVFVGGQHVIRDGRHAMEDQTQPAFFDVMRTLSSQHWEETA